MSSAPDINMDVEYIRLRWDRIREPLYVFAVGDTLTVTMTDEVNGLAQRVGLIWKKDQKNYIACWLTRGSYVLGACLPVRFDIS